MSYVLIFVQLASQILSSLSKENNGPYASNWLERLRQIKRIQNKMTNLENQPPGSESVQTGMRSSSGGQVTSAASIAASRSKVHMSDFTEYT